MDFHLYVHFDPIHFDSTLVNRVSALEAQGVTLMATAAEQNARLNQIATDITTAIADIGADIQALKAQNEQNGDAAQAAALGAIADKFQPLDDALKAMATANAPTGGTPTPEPVQSPDA